MMNMFSRVLALKLRTFVIILPTWPTQINFHNIISHGFLNEIDLLWGYSLGKMTKNCIKISKSTFLGQNSGGLGGQANFVDSEREPPEPPPPPLARATLNSSGCKQQTPCIKYKRLEWSKIYRLKIVYNIKLTNSWYFVSVCRSCLIKYLESSYNCPKCNTEIHKTKPLEYIR